MIAKKVTIARQEKKEIVKKVELKKLSETALNKVSLSYMLYPELKGLDHTSKLKVYDRTSVDHPIEVVFPLIDYEYYWQRACGEHFKGVDCAFHGNSWKQCYAENYIKKVLSSFNVEKDKIENVTKYFDILKFYIFNLEVPTFSADFDISKIPQIFVNLTTLDLKYSPILADQNRDDILKKQLERKNNIYEYLTFVAIKEEYTKFGMRMSDLKQFSVAIGDLSYLLSLTLQGNFIDDEMTTWLIPGLISNHTLRYLDLSNNKITDKGMIRISSFLMRSRTLISLDLANNQIGGKGGFAISLVIKENTLLKIIKLSMNRIDDVNGSKIIKAIAKNDYLEELDLSSNELSSFTSQALNYAFKINKNLKILELCHNNITINTEVKAAIESHQNLIKLDLRSTKCSNDDVKIVESNLIKKSVKQNLQNKKIKK